MDQKKYKRHHDRYIRHASIFNEGDEVYQDRPFQFCSAAEGYNKLLRRMEGRDREQKYCTHTTGRTGKYSLHPLSYTGSQLRMLLQQNRRGRTIGRIKLNRRETALQNGSGRNHYDAENLYVGDKIVGPVGSGPQLEYVVRWYGCHNADNITKRPHHISQPLSTLTGIDSTSTGSKRPVQELCKVPGHYQHTNPKHLRLITRLPTVLP